MADKPPAPPSVLYAGLLCRCPNCGKGPLFEGYLRIRESCTHCGEDLAAHEQGDGPAVFVMMILGFIVVGLALFVELRFAPPLWVHAVLWLPVTLLGALGMLRPFMAIMVALHFRHRKGEVERG